jgi:hypothetical protein
VPALGNRLRQGPTVANPTFQPGGDETVDGFGDMVGEASDINAPAEAYDLMETPTAPAVPVHRIGGRGNDKKEKRARAPRWMVATAIFACLLSVAAIVLELMSDGSSSSGGSTDPHSTQQVGSPVSSADLAALQTRLDAYAANVTLLQQQLSNISGSSELVLTTAPPTPHQVSSSDLAALQTQLDRFITNVTLLQQLVVDQAITIASLQSQLNFAPTSQPTTAPTRSPTATPTFVPTTTPTFSPSNAPTFAPSHAPSHSPTSSPTQLPTAAPTVIPTHAPSTAAPTARPTIAPSVTAPVPSIVAAARQLGLLLPNGTFLGDVYVGTALDLAQVAPLFEYLVDVRGELNFQFSDAAFGNLHGATPNVVDTVMLRFPILQSVGSFRIALIRQMSLNGSFPSLQTVRGNMEFFETRVLSLSGGFPALQSVGRYLTMNDVSVLTSVATGFPSLVSVGSISMNGCVSPTGNPCNPAAFCSSYAARLCPATMPTEWNAASTCCTQFCSTSPTC